MSTLTNSLMALPVGLEWDLRAAYAQPPRAYHTFGHALEVLRNVEEVAAGPGWHHPREVVIAALFHDAVYMPRRKDNEARSADLAAHCIATHLTSAGLDVERVRRLILLTARHGKLTPADVEPDEALFLDCDMAILGTSPEVFDAYDAGVAEEYRTALPSFVFRFNRRRFLSHLLAQPRIFLSDFFHARLDEAARANLCRTLGRD